MIRKEAIELCLDEIKEQPIIAANGFISRDLFNAKDRNTNFYMIGSMGIVFDNSVHESTGGQPTNSNFVNIEKIAKACNYNHTFTVKTKNGFEKILRKIKKLKGPIMIVVKIQQSNGEKSARINHEPTEIKERFMQS